MKHDEYSRKDVPAIYSRILSARTIKTWPTGGFAIPKVNGRRIVNNTGKPVYVCAQDGIIHQIPTLTKSSREGVLLQLYYALGVHHNFEHGNGLEAKYDKAYTIRFVPTADKQDQYVHPSGELITYNYETSSFVKVALTQWHRILDQFSEVADTEGTSPRETRARNNLIRQANDMDSMNALTRALRHDEHRVFIVDFMFESHLRTGKDADALSQSRIVKHHAMDGCPSEMLNVNFQLDDDSNAVSPEDFFTKRSPSMVFSSAPVDQLRMARRGFYMPEYGFTMSMDQDLENKALSWANPGSDNYMARTGFNIIIPKKIGRKGVVYCRIGKHVTKIICTDTDSYESDVVRVYGTSPTGESIILGFQSVDEILSKGIDILDPSGSRWNIPFFDSSEAAYNYEDEDELAIRKQHAEEMAVMRKKAIDQQKELDRFYKEEAASKQSNWKAVSNFCISIMTNPTVLKAAAGILITLVTTVLVTLGLTAS